jgi:hypothetical protein
MVGQNELYKFEKKSNYDLPGKAGNVYLYQYSHQYAESILGKFRHLSKFFGPENAHLADLLREHMDGNFEGVAHPDSVFMRYIWDKSYSLEMVGNHPQLRTPQ